MRLLAKPRRMLVANLKRMSPQRLTRAVVRGSGYRDINLNLGQLTNVTQTVVSTISTSSDYDISVIQLVGADHAVISDEQTGKAVLGLGAQNLEAKVDGISVNLSNVGYSAAAAEAASIECGVGCQRLNGRPD